MQKIETWRKKEGSLYYGAKGCALVPSGKERQTGNKQVMSNKSIYIENMGFLAILIHEMRVQMST